jgi:CheY-like chemotaxis protein
LLAVEGAANLRQIADFTVSSRSSEVVLVVDDDQDIRDALCELLEDEGYHVVSAANGREALAYLGSREPPCVILLDLMMPIMDGWEFRRRQQGDPKWANIPVVVITAAGQYGSASIDADRVLPKPLQLDHVLEALQQFC